MHLFVVEIRLNNPSGSLDERGNRNGVDVRLVGNGSVAPVIAADDIDVIRDLNHHNSFVDL